MNRVNRFNQRAALCALLLCCSLNVSADDFQDAHKLFRKGQLAEALRKVDAVLLAQPKDVQARFLKGVILTDQGQVEEAARIFIALTEDYPELPEPYNNLAVIYAGQGQYDKAKTALEKAIHTHPSYATAHENLGDIYARMASQAYDRALQLDRSNTSAKTRLALVKDLFNPAPKATAGTKTQVASTAAAVPASAPPVATPASTPAVLASTASANKTEPAPAKHVVAEAAPTNPSDDVLKATNEWVNAWSSKNVNKYLSMYAKDFKTPGNEPRNNWEQQRRERIAKPLPITVTISNTKVNMLNDKHAKVSFIQFYRSGALKSTTRKTLEMGKTNGSWQILSELTGG
jgi:tetratricopeptide (TPR) repeat protein